MHCEVIDLKVGSMVKKCLYEKTREDGYLKNILK